MSVVERVVVAVPVRDEEALLPACLESLAAAAERLRHDAGGTRRSAVPVDVVVALDRCTDRSHAVASRHPVRVVELAAGSAGAARFAAAAAGLAAAAAAGGSAATTWLSSTDADTVVPAHWFVRQLEIADAGADLVLGTVEPDDHLPPALRRAWRHRHVLAEGHPHVHGANLGVRAAAYLAVGGFAGLPAHEDVDLVHRLRRAGTQPVSTDRIRVRTSSRRRGRAPQGFAGYLSAMGRAPAGSAQNTGLPPVTPRTVPET